MFSPGWYQCWFAWEMSSVFMYLSTCSSVVVLFRKDYGTFGRYGLARRSPSLGEDSVQLPVCPLRFVFSIEDVIPELPPPAACCRPSPAMMNSSSRPVSTKQTPPFSVALCHDITAKSSQCSATHMSYSPQLTLSEKPLKNPCTQRCTSLMS